MISAKANQPGNSILLLASHHLAPGDFSNTVAGGRTTWVDVGSELTRFWLAAGLITLKV